MREKYMEFVWLLLFFFCMLCERERGTRTHLATKRSTDLLNLYTTWPRVLCVMGKMHTLVYFETRRERDGVINVYGRIERKYFLRFFFCLDEIVGSIEEYSFCFVKCYSISKINNHISNAIVHEFCKIFSILKIGMNAGAIKFFEAQ